MKRRNFLSHAIKSASAAFWSQFFPPNLRDSLFSQTAPPKTSPNNSARPQLALTLADPTLPLGSALKWQAANGRLFKPISGKALPPPLSLCPLPPLAPHR